MGICALFSFSPPFTIRQPSLVIDYSRHGLDRILLLSARQLRWSVGSGAHDHGFGLCHWSLDPSESFVVAYRPVNRLYQLPSVIREIVCTVLAKGDAWFVELAQ